MAAQNKEREQVSPVISQPAEIGLALAVLLATIAVVVGRVLVHITSLSAVELGAVAAVAGVYWIVWVGRTLAPRFLLEQSASDRDVNPRHGTDGRSRAAGVDGYRRGAA